MEAPAAPAPQSLDSNNSNNNSSSNQSAAPPRDDPRVEFIRRLVLRTFSAVKPDKLNRLLATDSVATQLFEFLHVPDARLLLFTDHGSEFSGTLKVYSTPPPQLFHAGSNGSNSNNGKSVCVLYFVKAVKAAVSLERVHEELLTGTLERDALESLAHILHEILIPLIGNPRNQRLWPEMVTTSVINNVHGFFSSLQITVGQTRGATCLPLPWDQILTENAPAAAAPAAAPSLGTTTGSNQHRVTLVGSATAVSASLMKDQVHALEGCLITWTKQIKNILKQDPEALLNRKAHGGAFQSQSPPQSQQQQQQQSLHHQHPGPLEELAFWAAKARNLNSIFAQLQSDSVRKVLQYLDASKSTYNVPFAKLCKEVFLARAEANDNLHFLTPLTPWFQRLATASVTTVDVTTSADSDVSSEIAAATTAFTSIRELFRPICHALLLIWKCSRFYNTPSRLVVLVRQICNEIIRCATRFLNGATLFALIERDALETANAMLRTCLQVGAAFKSVYFDYKARSSTEVPANPWRVQNNALFVRLDAFLERCHDVLELTQTIDQFQKLATLEIGGTKGKTLTTSVHQIFNDFRDTLLVMRSVPYDLMDLDAKAFEDDFYAFRSRNKELERRLASVISQAFDDAKTIHARFKCLDCFEDLLDRAIIKNELERKYTALLASYATDLHVVQQLFIEHREHPPIPHNLPPFAGAVTWSRGLAERIRFPMDKLRQIAPRVVMDREDAKDAIKLYTNVLAMLQEFEVQTVKKWGVSIETSSKAKLKLPLIRRDVIGGATGGTTATATTTESSGLGAQQLMEMATMASSNGTSIAASSSGSTTSSAPTMLFVNFDAALVQLLREVKYFLLLGIEIPEDALAIYKKAEVFRRQTGNLALIVDLYNTIHATLLPVERPLVKTYLDRMDQALTKGIKALNWKSHGIDVFLKESMTDVNDANALLSQLRAHQTRVTELLAQWLAPPLLFERKNKPLPVAEFEELQRALCQQKYQQLKDGGNEIHRLLKDAIKVLRVSTGSPDWRAYVDYVSARVEDGLTAVVVQSLTHLRDQLDPRRIEHDDLSALLEVELDLYGKGVVYFPPIASTATRNGVRDVVVRRIEAILHAATVFKRLDTSDGSYLKEMREHVDVQRLIADISSFLDQNEAKCNALRLELAKYEYLWTTDLAAMFSQFLATAWRPLPPTSSAFRYADAIPTATSPAPAAVASSSASSSSSAAKKSVLLTLSPVASSSSSSSSSPLPPLPAQLLDLPKFEAQIHHFLALQNEISDAKAARDVGFVRVNALPVKQALATWVTKWIYLFTQYLHDRVVAQLAWLDQFLARVANGLDLHHELDASSSVANEQSPAPSQQQQQQQRVETADEKAALMSCMQHIRDVRRLMREELLVNFAGLKDVVTLLKANGIALDLSYVGSVNVLAFLEQAPLRWEATVNKAFKKKELITPLQTQMVESIRSELSELSRRVLALRDDFARVAPFAMPLVAVDDAYVALDASHDALARLEADAARLAELEDMFELAPSRHDALLALRRDLVQLKQLWDLAALQDAVYARWQTLPWLDLDTDALMDEADALERVLRSAVAPAAIARVREWPVYLELTQRMTHMVVVLPLVKSLHSPAMRERHWKSLMALTKRHFDLAPAAASASASAANAAASASNVTSALRLEEVLRLELHRFVNEVNELVEVASREFKIEQQLQAIETAWTAFTLEFLPFKTAGGGASAHPSTTSVARIHEADDENNGDDENEDESDGNENRGGGADAAGGDVMILKPPTAILECLEDHQLQLQSMAAMGKFVAYFRDRVFDWQLRLGNVDVVLKLWLALQRQWCSLESIFLSAAGDLQASLPQEFTRFTHVDAEMRELLQDARAAPSVLVACCQREGRELVLRDLATELEHCQRALHQYLDAKKDVFPRFYFVSNASLLEILSNGNVPPRIQPHVANCFDGIKAFEFDKLSANHSTSDAPSQQPSRRRSSALQQQQQQLQRYVAQAMISKEGEVVRFPDALVLHGAVEQWFNDLVRVMQDTLREWLRDALEASALWGVDTTRVAWSLERAAQLALLASQIVWTEEVEAALEELESGTEDALKKYADVSTVRLEELIRVVQGALSALDRQKVITLITVDVHARDVVQALLAKRVTSSLDFAWQSQLRYYAAPAKARDVVIKICDFRAFYSYEYTGNCGRLVITPLTDRCYVTLTTALRLCLGGAPAGPAGTGKTETTKDLARGLGLQCYVFNCSDQMNYRTMADIFKGLSATGAWGCFDEFNRISVEVLSVVATQVKTVLDALVPLAAGLHRLVTACSSSSGSSGSSHSSSTNSGGGLESAAALAASASSGALPTAMAGTCEFFGKTIALLPSVGLFITMNPGYAGRAELPENLKALFRSCAMIRPGPAAHLREHAHGRGLPAGARALGQVRDALRAQPRAAEQADALRLGAARRQVGAAGRGARCVAPLSRTPPARSACCCRCCATSTRRAFCRRTTPCSSDSYATSFRGTTCRRDATTSCTRAASRSVGAPRCSPRTVSCARCWSWTTCWPCGTARCSSVPRAAARRRSGRRSRRRTTWGFRGRRPCSRRSTPRRSRPTSSSGS
ncbi:hypothetical protein PINS_up009916 [Pythium insidiosum]|nr:hypothetical protein PINS_up009916 [Pythium insidiosum]